MKRTYKEIFVSTLGWIIYLTGYLILSIVTITIIQMFKVGLNWQLAIPVFIKWEFLVIVFAFALANVVYFWQKVVQRFILFGGLLRLTIILVLSYFIATAVYPYVMMPVKFAYVVVDEIESALFFIMIILVIFRINPQRYYDNPDGPTFGLPVKEKQGIVNFSMFHSGIDFEQDWGTPVYAAADGKVATAWPFSLYGNMVKIVHQDNWSTVYGQLAEIVVNHHQLVKKGDLIGYVGSTGYAFSPHLHFEIRSRNKVVDPQKYLEGMKEKKKQKK